MTEEIRYKKDGFDLEAGSSRRDYPEDEDDGDGPFDIFRTKSAPVHRLRRWRQAALVLNASRRFRYTLDLKKAEERRQLIAKIRTHAQVIRAAVLFQEAGRGLPGAVTSTLPLSPTQNSDFGISSEELVAISKEHDLSVLLINFLNRVLMPMGIKEGWYDGGSIALAVIIVIVFTVAVATSLQPT
ncbi:calcium-transporting ATPase 10, plasma membrane-type-like [Salvia hispanica]|uniref:calcium-transporting ATPase 10, plasma membrane-type-like n=1 Tax=Salvia hispanica TaxID=49212 RepID=UPI002009A36B|nr:calcium-transporting ATPase 10, plasma membrane-type-like [Salvia hispanica]